MVGVEGVVCSTEYGAVPVITGAGAEEGSLEIAAGRFVLVERTLDNVLFEVVAQPGGSEDAEALVVVLDQDEDDMNLGSPVGLVAIEWTLDMLNVLDEVSSQGVQVFAVGIFSQKAASKRYKTSLSAWRLWESLSRSGASYWEGMPAIQEIQPSSSVKRTRHLRYRLGRVDVGDGR